LLSSPELCVVEIPGKRLRVAAALKSGNSCILLSETILAILSEASCWLIASNCPCA